MDLAPQSGPFSSPLQASVQQIHRYCVLAELYRERRTVKHATDRHYYVDTTLERWANSKGFLRFALVPPLLQHVGSKSSKGWLQGRRSNIGAPLRPENTDWLHVRIAYDRSFKAAKGGELVMSLAATIYYAWVDTANEPIGTPKRVRRIPFLNFQYIIRPSAAREAVLNPFKLGIAYCWIIDSLLKQQDWPGCINADLSDNNDRSIAILQVANVPQDSGAPPKAAADKALEKVLFANESYSTRTRRNHNGNGPGLALAIPIEIERRWFTCLYSMLLFIVAKPTTSRVASELPPFPFSTDVKTYHFTCDPEDPTNKDRIDVYISSASRDARNGLTWDALAKTLLLFGTRIADDGDWESEQLVVHQDVVTAALGISLDHASGASDEA
ncbi:MAG: hypothetical protein LQ346_003717 [Caloplaca aetnensis]|nr:MAG: hypothetical protein LQ346_003717 [Caloplaca aetnensis]